MENKTMSTSFQSEAEDFMLTQNTSYEPVVKTDTSTEEAMYSDLHDYSDYQLPKANVKDTKPPQQPVQYTVGKKSFAAIIILLSNVEHIMEQVNEYSNLSLIQDTMNSIVQQIMVHANNTNRSTDELLQLLNTSLIKDISIPTAAAVNDVLLIVNELLVIQQNRSSLFNSIRPVSCKKIKTVQPSSPSGYYHVNSRNIYCNMGELCGQDGGWTRIAYLDMNDSSQNCPSGLEESMTGGIKLCRREGDSVGCKSNVFQTNGISYSQICGKVVGYQMGTTNAVRTNVNDINDAYIDGVSITRGSPRQHVWSYIAGYKSNTDENSTCPCNTGATDTVPSFVGENYYCESGTNSNPSHGTVYTGDPL
uniref:Fibrinogen C-terminal domain-containing protein n=1 Tax=Amphimedon queenslandica TaxID=400682 RepID=A0A1X7SU30_AMPQE